MSGQKRFTHQKKVEAFIDTSIYMDPIRQIALKEVDKSHSKFVSRMDLNVK